MENINQTSFIPKQSLAPVANRAPRSVSGLNLIAWFLFIVSLLGAGGTFLWNKALEGRINSMNSQIADVKGKLEEDTIYDIKELEKRLKSSEEILNSHIATSKIFEVLQQRTLKTISFNKFAYSIADPTGKSKTVTVSMAGRAKNYDAIAQQAEELAKNEYIINPIFSNMTLDEIRGTISFDLTFVVNPALVSYESLFNSQSQGFDLIN